MPAFFEPIEPRLLFTAFPVTNTLASGAGSLHDQIMAANANPGPDSITFAIGSGAVTINFAGSIPAISESLTIDGTTQPGFAGTPLVTISGQNLPVDGFVVNAGPSTIRGLNIRSFQGNGIKTLAGANGNVFEGNVITLNLTDGIDINSSNNRVGGTTVAQRNVISGNSGFGIDIGSSSTGNVVQGNFIGVTAAGTATQQNGASGVRIVDASGNTIGGTTAAERNVISGNKDDGVRISGSASSNTISGNYIGTNASGTGDLGNKGNGVNIFSPNNLVGGTASGAGNLISGNDTDGVVLEGSTATGNRVEGNLIGTNPSGTVALGNGQLGLMGTGGVRVNGGANNTIGGTASGAGNLISGNFADGIRIDGVGATGNVMQGNKIGTNAAGAGVVANRNDGIQVTNGANTIGGTTAAARNILSGNLDDGIELQASATSGTVVQGNYIGTDVTGATALANASDGIEIEGAVNNTIGGAAPGARNILSGNASDGIEIFSAPTGPATGNIIDSNSIGVNASGAPLANVANGIRINDGGSEQVRNNTISGNGANGVLVVSSSGNSIQRNSIAGNGAMGIELGVDGVTANDAGDPDAGPNDLQNYPTIISASPIAGGTSVLVALNSTPSSSFTIDLYANSAADASGFGEGATWIGSGVATTNASGDATVTITAASVSAGQVITATATAVNGSTSEFSHAAPIGADNIPPVVNAANFSFDGATLPAAPHRLVYQFSENVSASLSTADLSLQDTTHGTTVPAASIALGYDAGTNTATFTFPGFTNGVLPDARYTATLLAAGVTDAAGNALAANQVTSFFVLAGDANHDATVNLSDFNVLAGNFGQSGRIFSQGDFNYDGTVNLADFNILAARFGTSVAPNSETGTSSVFNSTRIIDGLT